MRVVLFVLTLHGFYWLQICVLFRYGFVCFLIDRNVKRKPRVQSRWFVNLYDWVTTLLTIMTLMMSRRKGSEVISLPLRLNWEKSITRRIKRKKGLYLGLNDLEKEIWLVTIFQRMWHRQIYGGHIGWCHTTSSNMAAMTSHEYTAAVLDNKNNKNYFDKVL